jgi:dephospho-CoA kinase
MIIIGITGTLGSGKGTIVKYLVREKGFTHYSVREYLLEEIRKRNLPENRDSMVMVANELRQNNSPSYITDQLFKQALKQNSDVIIESIRTPGEAESLRSKGEFYLFAVDADPKIRFNRIKLRNSETDQIDFDTFIANEKREMTATDPNKQNLNKCREMADFVFMNDGNREDLNQAVDNVLTQININSSRLR